MRARLPLSAVAVLVIAVWLEADVSASASRLLTVTPQEFLDTCRADVAAAQAAVARLKAPAPAGPAGAAAGPALARLDEYDTAMGLLVNARDRSQLAWNVHPDRAVREAATRCEAEVDRAKTDLSLDGEVFAAIERLDLSGADAATRHYVQRALRDFRRAGVDRDEKTRARIKALSEELITLGQQFGSTVAADVRTIEVDPADLDGLPDDFRRAHPPGPNGKVVLTTNNTDYVPFLTYARSAAAREALWKVYRQRGHPKNLDVLRRMLAARREMAGLLGYASWADYVTADKMIGSRDNVAAFIARITAAAGQPMSDDYAAILARKRRDDPQARAVDAWDSVYLQEQVKSEQYGFDSQDARPYFEYNRARQGVMDLTSRMFGIAYRAVPDAPVWHPDVEVFDVVDTRDAAGRVLGRIYLDMFPREDKYKHYAQFTLVNGRSGRAMPEAALVCNFPKPGAEPALMLHTDLETLFHEWGHLLHHVFGGHTRWSGISGTTTEWDFVEAPSQMLEEWTWTPETLQTFARHYETGEPIPTDLVRRMKAASEFGKGLYVRQQMFYAALSLDLHTRDPEGLDTSAVVAELQGKYTPFAFVPGTTFETSFTHLDGYSALYYTYMWSLVIAKDMFTMFDRNGLLDADTAARYRRAVLEPGSSKPAADLVSDFLGRPYSFAAYEAWLAAGPRP
jgi:thimet oligopeptidase